MCPEIHGAPRELLVSALKILESQGKARCATVHRKSSDIRLVLLVLYVIMLGQFIA